VFFLIGGLADACRPPAGTTAKAMCKAVGSLLAGLVAWLLLFALYIVVNGLQLA
jgi:hypothetical protein